MAVGLAQKSAAENVDKARQATMNVCLDGKVEQRVYDLNDAALENLDAWGDAILGKAVYPISHRQLVHNIEIMQAIVDSSYSNRSVAVKFASPSRKVPSSWSFIGLHAYGVIHLLAAMAILLSNRDSEAAERMGREMILRTRRAAESAFNLSIAS